MVAVVAFIFCLAFLFSKACGNKVDPVYEALRFGTSLAQRAKRTSGSESPHRKSVRTASVLRDGSALINYNSINLPLSLSSRRTAHKHKRLRSQLFL